MPNLINNFLTLVNTMFQKTLIFQKDQNSSKMNNLISETGVRRNGHSIYDFFDNWLVSIYSGCFYDLFGLRSRYNLIPIMLRRPPVIQDSRLHKNHQCLHWRSKPIG